MKKIVSGIMLTLFLVCISTVSFNITSVIASETTIFEDDFESYAVGSFPSVGEWELVYSGKGTQYQIITDIVSYSPTKSLQLWGQNGWSANVQRKFTSSSGVIGYEAYMRAESNTGSADHVAQIAFWNLQGAPWGKRFAVVQFDEDGNIYTAPLHLGPIYVTLGPYEANRWYKFRVVIDRTAGAYDVWIDGVLAAQDIAIADTYEIEAIMLESGHAEVKTYFDNVKIFEVGAPPPPSYTLTIYSSPAGVTFTVDGVSRTTPWSGTYSEGASVSFVVPETHDGYVWSRWLEDGDTNRTKTIVLTGNTTWTGVFRFLADINGDGIVNIKDIIICALAFGSKPSDLNWDPRADLNDDNRIDIFDLVMIAIHFGETWPRAPLLWNYTTGGRVYTVYVSPNNEYVIAGSDDRNVYCLDLATGQKVWKYNTGEWTERVLISIYSVFISPDNKYAIAGTATNVYCFNITNGNKIWNYTTGAAWSVFVSPNNKYVLAGSSSGNIFCFDISNGTLKWSYPAGGYGFSVFVSPDGKYVLAGFKNGVIALDINGNFLWNYDTNGYVPQKSLFVSPDSKYVIAGSTGLGTDYGRGRIYALNITNGQQIWNYTATGPFLGGGSNIPIVAVFVSSDSNYVAAATGNGVTPFLHISDGHLIWNYSTGGYMWDVCISPDGKFVVTGSVGIPSNVRCLDTADGSIIWNFFIPYWCPTSISISPDSKTIIVGWGDNNVYAFREAPTPIGGIYIPVNKPELLSPCIGLTMLLAVAVMKVGYVKKRKRKTEISS